MNSADVFATTKSHNMYFDPKKLAIDNSMSYPCSNHILMNSSTVMTPTSPHTFYLPSKSFNDSEYQVQAENQNKSTVLQQTNYESECFNWFDVGSVVETPNSAQSAVPSASTATATATAKNVKDEIFNFEPEYIEFFQRYCETDKTETTKSIDLEQSDTDYVNFNETNCQSKLMCTSPNFETWINSGDSVSPKPENALPPISSISEQFNQTNYLDQDDFSMIESDPNIGNHTDFQSFNNLNLNLNQAAENKSNRDEKNIWEILDFESSQPDSPTDNLFIDEILDCKNEMMQPNEVDKISNVEDNPKDVTSKDWICQWEECFKAHPNQCSLVSHLVKTHIEERKGNIFSCYWQNCTRQQKPFNARYKLLIHMRVHSGEKPNRCQVSTDHIHCIYFFNSIYICIY